MVTADRGVARLQRLLRSPTFWAVLVLICAPLLTWQGTWASGDLATHLWGDPLESYWPDMVYMHRAFSDGVIPWWNPFDRGGFPFAADPQPGVLYPANWLLQVFAGLLGDFPHWLIEVKMLGHVMLAGVAMFVFLRGRRLPVLAAMIGGLVFQLGPYFADDVQFSLTWPVAWAPLLMWATDRLLARPGWGPALLWATFGWLLATAGSPPGAFYAALVVLPYAGLRTWQYRHRGGSWRALAPWAAMALGLAAVMALPVLTGMMAIKGQSVLSEPRFKGYVDSGSMQPMHLLGLGVRHFTGSFSLYVGIPALLLAGLGALRACADRSHVRLQVFVFVLGLVLVLGRHTSALESLYLTLPPFRFFRLAMRFNFLIDLSIAVLAAYGLAHLMRHRDDCAAYLKRAAQAVAALFAIALVGGMARKVLPRADLNDLWLACMFGGLALLAMHSIRTRGARLATGAALAAIVLLDLSTAAVRSQSEQPRPAPTTPQLAPEELAKVIADAPRVRYYDEFAIAFRSGSRYGLRDFRGYMDPLRLKRYDDVIGVVHKHPTVLATFNVAGILHAPHPILGMSHHKVQKPQSVRGLHKRGKHLYAFDDPMPWGFWVGGSALYPTPEALLKALPRLDASRSAAFEQPDLSAAAMERVQATTGRARQPHVPATLVERSPNEVTFQVDSPGAGWFVFNEAWFPGWGAELDGEPVEVVRANHLVQAVPMDAGAHRVTFTFSPSYIIWPALLSWLAYAAALGGFFAIRRRRRRRAGAPTEEAS